MDEKTWMRIAGVAGILTFLCWVTAGVIDSGTEVEESTATAQQVARFMTEEGNRSVSRALFILASAGFMVLLVAVYRRLRVAERHGMGATAALVGGVAWVALNIDGAPSNFLAAWLPAAEASPDALVAIWATNVAGVTSSVALSVMLLATGAVSVATRALPRWLGWAALVLGVLELVDSIAPFGPTVIVTGWTFFLVPLWILATGIALLRRPAVTAAAAPAMA